MANYIQSSTLGSNRYALSLTLWLSCFLLNSVGAYAHITVQFEISNPVCNEQSDGSIISLVCGGEAPYTFVWSDGSTEKDLLGVGAGQYSITVTDCNGDSTIATVKLEEPSPVTANLAFTGNICSDPDSIIVEASGGVAPYSYRWTDGSKNASIVEIKPGLYCVTVLDANLCAVISCIEAPEPLTLDLTGTSPTCLSSEQGSATAIAVGGKPPYSYQWSNGVTTANNPGLDAGTYMLSLSDANDCMVVDTITIGAATSDVEVEIAVTDPACMGKGGLMATASGGLAPYSFVWDNGQTEANLTNLSGGTYAVTVTDANGCSSSKSIELIGSSDLDVAVEFINYTCGEEFGSISVVALAGVPPYTFAWDDGQTAATAINLLPGILHTVTVTDAAGCQVARDFPVIAPSGLEFDLAIKYADCTDFAGAEVTVIPVGDPADHNYTWSNNTAEQTAVFFEEGSYFVAVCDNKGCCGVASFNLTSPVPISCTITENKRPTTKGTTDGQITASVQGGTGPYTFAWSNGETTASLSDIGVGTYTVSVTDANGCTSNCTLELLASTISARAEDSNTLAFQNRIGNNYSNKVGVYPNPFKQYFFIELPEGQINQAVNVSLETYYGQRIKSYNWDAQGTRQEIQTSDLTPGLYIVRVAIGEEPEKIYRIVKNR